MAIMGRVREEKNFPRGNVEIKAPLIPADRLPAKPVKRKVEKDLFSNRVQKPVVKKKKVKKDKDGQKESLFDVKSVASLSYSQLSEGQVLLGFVSQVTEFEVKVSLPGHLVGTVPITNISPAFTSRLRAAAEAEEGDGAEDVDIPPLDRLFKPGEVLAVAVVSVANCEGKYSVLLSLAPNRVSAGRAPGQGEILTAAVSSKEDHGYIMDLGSNTLRGFVSSKLMARLGSVEVGQVVWCLVTKSEAGVRSLSPIPSKVWSSTTSSPSLHNLFPGSRVQAKVEALLANGLKLNLEGGLTGYIHNEMLKDQQDMLADYAPGTEVEARVLYVTPTLNTVMLTLRDIRAKDVFGSLAVGSLVENAVIERAKKHQLLLRLGQQWGVVSARNMKEGREGVKNVKKKFPEGSSVTARVVGLDHCAGVAVCSLQRSQVSSVSRLDQLSVGQLLAVTVSSWVTAGLLVTLGHNVQGLVPRLFLSDVQLSHPERKFLPGDKLQARVLRLNPAERRLHLTTKPILVRENFTVVKDYETAVPGTVTEGVVVKISPEGLLIQLWGDLRGWAPKSKLSSEPLEMIEKVFWIGQAVKCQVVDADPGRDRITLSLVLDSLTPLGRKERRGQVLTLGRTYSATVTSLGEDSAEVKVEHEGKEVSATVPFSHLTDTVSLVSTLASSLKVGQILDCMAWHKDVATVLTRKKSLIDSFASSPKTYEEFHSGSLVPGVVTLVKKFGAFLRLSHLSKPVLCPTRLLQSYYVEEAADVLDVGQTLMCRVVEVDPQEKKMTVSCSLETVGWTVDSMTGLVRDWLEDQAEAGCWCPHKVGDIVTGSVTSVTEFGLLCDLAGVKAVVTNSNKAASELTEGSSVTGVVIFVDSRAKVVELSCQPDLLSLVTGRTEQVGRPGANMRGKVVMNKTEHGVCLVVVTHPKAQAGMLGHTATKRHHNDLAGLEQGEEGRQVALVLQEVNTRGEAVLVLKIEARRAEAKLGKNKRSRSLSQSEDVKSKKKKKSEPVATQTKEDELSETETAEKKKKKKKRKRKESEKSEPVEDSETAKDISAQSEELEKPKVAPAELKTPTARSDPGWNYSATCITAPAWKAASIWSEDEQDEEDQTVEKSHISKTEAKRLRKVEEERAAAREQRVLDGEVEAPGTVEEFERLVVGSPDSSLVWVQYMAMVMQEGQLDTARALAARALQRINFRLEEERLNIFLAWLNLENTFGTEEAMARVLKEALQCCDQFKVYSQVAAIYQQSGNFAEAEKTYKILTRKFNKEKEVWIKFGIFYYKNNKLSDGRFVLQRSLQSLDKREHIEMSSKFAQIEFRYGEAERGKTMFETILANYPKRTDLWSVYADQLVKTGELEAGRALFRRMSTLDLQAKKMKFLFKKWHDFEAGHGTEAGLSEVKQAAQKYLEGKGMGAKQTEDVDEVS